MDEQTGNEGMNTTFEGSINNGKTVYCISKGIEIGTLIENKRMGIKIGNATKVGNVYWIVED